jgi:cell wall assembly regulator SMI1
MQTIQQLLDRLEAWLRRHRSAYFKALHPAAGPADLAALDQALGTPTPPELKALLSWHNGQERDDVGCFEEDWTLLSAAEIATARQELTAGWAKNLIPFLDDDEGNYLGIDIGTPGHPVCTYLQDEPRQRRMAAVSLTAWLDDFVSHVERGQYHEDPERGSFLRAG